jgi:predicted Zn-dependent protease
MRFTRWRVAVLLLVLNGCGMAPRPDASSMLVTARPARDDEKLMLARAIAPLLGTEVWLHGDCAIALGIVASRAINAATWPGRTEPCVQFGLLVTEGALQTLPPGQMMALVAHELAHVHLGHLARPEESRPAPPESFAATDSTAGFALAFTDTEPIIDGLPRRFSPAEESGADRVAARLLFRAGHRTACLELAALLERLAGADKTPGAWLSTHPPLAQRAAQARARCDRGGSLTRLGGGALRVHPA